MASPPKPWEIAGVNRQNFGVGSFDPFSWTSGYGCGHDRRSLYRSAMRSGNGGGGGGLAGGAGGPAESNVTRPPRLPPPIPPRADKPFQQPQGSMYPRYSIGYNGFNPYGSFSGSLYNPSMYGSLGFRSMAYGSDFYNNSDNSFVRLAEESSRPAFQSIESIVHAVASVSMMLESTYHAVYSSFRAVIGVADHFSRLKNQLTQILTTLSLIRTLRWLCLKTLYLLGVTKENPSNEAAWSAASRDSQDLLEDRSRSSWPIIMFFSVVLGTPWLIWRLLSSLTPSNIPATPEWKGREDNHYIGVALFDFEGDGAEELGFHTGQEIFLAPRSFQPRIRGWLRASVDGKKVGLVPANYIKVMGLRKGFAVPQQSTTDDEAPSDLSVQNEQDLKSPGTSDSPDKSDTETK